jgi:hypothetical protein
MADKEGAVRVTQKPVIDPKERKQFMFFIDKEGYVAKVPYSKGGKKLSEEEVKARKKAHDKKVDEGKKLRAKITDAKKTARKTLDPRDAEKVIEATKVYEAFMAKK